MVAKGRGLAIKEWYSRKGRWNFWGGGGGEWEVFCEGWIEINLLGIR